MGQRLISANVKRLRIERGLTKAALARAAGMHRLTVARLEAGRRDDPRIETLRALAAALGVGVHDLIEPAISSGRQAAQHRRGGSR